MNGITHMKMTAVSNVALMAIAPTSIAIMDKSIYPVAMITTSVIAALLPDMDMKGSKAGKFIWKYLNILKFPAILSAVAVVLAIGYSVFTGADLLSVLGDSVGMRLIFGVPLIFASFIGLTALFLKNVKHRGFTHTLAIPLLLVAAWWFFIHDASPPLFCSMFLGIPFGFLFHILQDLFNKRGVPILWPIIPANVRVANVVTGKGSETVFQVLWVIGHIGIVVGWYIL
jgi:membrane-bound metal-dependent hydrolase YbcI (DUF457 family)